MADELAELQKEFRQSVLASLSELKEGQKVIDRDVQEIRLKAVDAESFKDMHRRLAAVEKTKIQLITSLVVLQTIFVCVWVVITTLGKA